MLWNDLYACFHSRTAQSAVELEIARVEMRGAQVQFAQAVVRLSSTLEWSN
jgi:hypothetical protein